MKILNAIAKSHKINWRIEIIKTFDLIYFSAKIGSYKDKLPVGNSAIAEVNDLQIFRKDIKIFSHLQP